MPFFGTGALKSTYRVYFSVHQILCSSVSWQNMEKGNLEWPEQVTSAKGQEVFPQLGYGGYLTLL